MNTNSQSFLASYDELKARITVFRENARVHGCSLGKFLADVSMSVLDSAYFPENFGDVLTEEKTVQLDADKNISAILKEVDATTGVFVIHPDLLPFFNEMQNRVEHCKKMTGMSREETDALMFIATLFSLYKSGQLHPSWVKEILNKE